MKMKLSKASILTAIVTSAVAVDLLFVDQLEYDEYHEATTLLGFSAAVVTEDQWRTLTTDDFIKYKAIILSDPFCGSGTSGIQFLNDTKAIWSPAITGNMVLIGTDPSYHYLAQPGAKVLIDNAVQFAAAGNKTGLYFSLSCYYSSVDTVTVDVLSEFGNFQVRGNLGCYNKVHLVASSPALGTLSDADLSNWSCSVHEAFSTYPASGVEGFEALAIAQDIIGAGSQTFGDGTIGLPYILARGATPAKCGDGHWDPSLGEECDDGNTISGDGCSSSCKCESGRPVGNGTCLPPLSSSASSSTLSSSSTSSFSSTSIISSTASSSPSSKPSSSSSSSSSTYVTVSSSICSEASATSTFDPSLSSVYDISSLETSITYTDSTETSEVSTTKTAPYNYPTIIGIEVIIVVEVSEDCQTSGTETITSFSTKECATLNRPIWNTAKPGYPCYVCALSEEGYSCPTANFITATTTSYSKYPSGYTHSPSPPVIQTCKDCSLVTLSTCPAISLPLPSGEPDYIVVAPTVIPHKHHTNQTKTEVRTDIYTAPYGSVVPFATAPTYRTAPAYSVVPTGNRVPSNVPYTGTAAGGREAAAIYVIGFVVIAVAVLL